MSDVPAVRDGERTLVDAVISDLPGGVIVIDRDGKIVHAQIDETVGEEAVYSLAIWRQGEFRFEAGVDTESRTITKSNTNLLMEAARRLDEWRVLSKKIPSVDLIPDHVRSTPTFHIPHVAVPPEGISLRDVIASFERRLIESTLESTGGVQKDAARLLGLKPTTLNEMIKRHSIVLPRERERRALKEIETAAKTTPA